LCQDASGFLAYPIVILLHNYLGVVNMAALGLSIPRRRMWVMRIADKMVMKSIMAADRIFVMDRAYLEDLTRRYPNANVALVDQDLYKLPEFSDPPLDHCRIAIMGNFGTYKRLEVLAKAFQLVLQEIPDARVVDRWL